MLTLFHDFASPASAVAVLRLHPLLDDGLDVRFVGYQPLPLEAPIPPTLEVLEQLERHAAEAADLGLSLRRPRRLPPTTRAHHVAERATDASQAVVLREALYRALWEEGRDIADADVLADLAGAAGLPATEVAEALSDRPGLSATKARLAEPRQAHVGGVPALDFDGTLVSPFGPLDDLRQLAAL